MSPVGLTIIFILHWEKDLKIRPRASRTTHSVVACTDNALIVCLLSLPVSVHIS